MLLGITLGWLISSTPTARLITQQNLSWLYLPQLLPYNQLHFHYSWLAPAILLGVLSSLETLTLSKTLDQRLSRPYHAKRQLKTQLVSATTTCLTGLTASPVSIIPGSIGDMLTSDSYSRHIAWIYSAALLALAFTPKVSGLLLLIPASVNGAVIIFMGSIMLLQALKNLNLNSMPARRAQVFGLGITVGIASLQLPPLVTTIHNHNPWITNPASLYSLASIGILLSLLKLRGVLHAH
jgi:xanthine/uracil permease